MQLGDTCLSLLSEGITSIRDLVLHREHQHHYEQDWNPEIRKPVLNSMTKKRIKINITKSNLLYLEDQHHYEWGLHYEQDRKPEKIHCKFYGKKKKNKNKYNQN